MKENKKYYSSFIRIGEKPYMERLFYGGEIYFNTLEYFKKSSQNKMYDPNEGAVKIIQGKNLNIKTPNDVIIFDKCQLYVHDNNLKGNLYCMFGLETKTLKPTKIFRKLNLNLEDIDWGDTVVYIYNTCEFLNRVENSFKENNIEFKLSPVDYYDDKIYEGNLDIFKKSIRFKNQNEIRYWIPNPENKAFKISIGNISDISILLSKSEISKMKYDFK